MPRRAKRSTPEAATTASRSASRAGREKSSTVQSDRPKPRSSYRTTVASAPSWSRKWRQTGLCQSYWRWLSQHDATISGGPLPWIAYASRTPSAARQNLISCCGASDDPAGVPGAEMAIMTADIVRRSLKPHRQADTLGVRSHEEADVAQARPAPRTRKTKATGGTG